MIFIFFRKMPSFVVMVFLTMTAQLWSQEWEQGGATGPFQKAYQEGYQKGLQEGQRLISEKAKIEFQKLKDNCEQRFAEEVKEIEATYSQNCSQIAISSTDSKSNTPTISSYKDKKIEEVLAKSAKEVFEEAREKIKELPDEEIEKTLIEQMADGPMGEIIHNSPFIKRFLVGMIKDDYAAPGLLEISNQKSKIWLFFFASLFAGAISFFIGKKLKKMTLEAYGDPEEEAIVRKKRLIFTGSKFGFWLLLILILFGSNIYPTIRVFFRAI